MSRTSFRRSTCSPGFRARGHAACDRGGRRGRLPSSPRPTTARFSRSKTRSRVSSSRTRPSGRGARDDAPPGRRSASVATGARPAPDGARQLRDRRRAPAMAALFDGLMTERPQAPEPALFQSYFQGGFECSTHRLRQWQASRHHRLERTRPTRRRGLSPARRPRHPHGAGRLSLAPDRTCSRCPGLVQHRPHAAGRTANGNAGDLGSPALRLARRPRHLEPGLRRPVRALRRRRGRNGSATSPTLCLSIARHEISFSAWGGGRCRIPQSFANGRGFELKVQLCGPRSRPCMHPRRGCAREVRPLRSGHQRHRGTDRPHEFDAAEGHRQAQYQAWDMIAGLSWPQLGGTARLLDIVGVNYYSNNHGSMAADDRHRHALYRPLHRILMEIAARYGRPILLAETGIEFERRAAWLRHAASELAMARRKGVSVEGLCLYPVLNHLAGTTTGPARTAPGAGKGRRRTACPCTRSRRNSRAGPRRTDGRLRRANDR